MPKSYVSILPISAVLCLVLLLAVGLENRFTKTSPQEQSNSGQSITILWAKWKPADYLQELAREFTIRTGIDVHIEQESWTSWQSVFFDEMSRKGDRYDMVIGDSQWLGRGARGGYYIELTRWIREHGIDQSMTPTSITGYSEFPKKSGHYWAIPVEGDAMGFSYRKDLFEDPQEQLNFKSRYNYPLAVPETWSQLKDIAEFFYRPQDDLYGVLCWQDPEYDGLTMGLESLIWAWGADLGNPSTHRVKGILNSQAGIAALHFYKQLNTFNNPEWVNNYLDKASSSNQPMMQGRVAMAMGYFAISPELLDKEKNPYADVIGFFAAPRGPGGRATSLGGQGISLISFSKKKDLSLQFLEWFITEATQVKWAALGGLSCNRAVLNSDSFLNASPINRPFQESIEMVRDFWAVPEYPELLAISQKYWSEYLSQDQLSAKETMNGIAREWEAIFEYAGYYKE